MRSKQYTAPGRPPCALRAARSKLSAACASPDTRARANNSLGLDLIPGLLGGVARARVFGGILPQPGRLQPESAPKDEMVCHTRTSLGARAARRDVRRHVAVVTYGQPRNSGSGS